jgi:hypothetical protein
MICILIYKFLGQKLDLPDSFIILGILELAIESWLLVIWSVIMALKFIF